MTITPDAVKLSHTDCFFIGGEWVKPSSGATITVTDSATEAPFLTVPEAGPEDMAKVVAAARVAFDQGEWPRLSHAERATYLRAMGAGIKERSDEFAQLWPRESGATYSMSRHSASGAASFLERYAALAETFPFEEEAAPSFGAFGVVVREPVGVVGAIVPWNFPLSLAIHKIAPALLAGCTVILKASPEAPGEAYVLAEVAEAVGLPKGAFNVVTADREVSELLVTDPRVDKITFTGSTAAGRRIGSICGGRVARFTLELGGKSAAVILDDADLEQAAAAISGAECRNAGQVCSSLTRLVVTRRRHDEFVQALAAKFSGVQVGDPFDDATEMGPLASEQQRSRVLGYVAKGVQSGAKLVTGGDRPGHLERGWYVEPTVFGEVDNSSVIAQEEIFGPVLSVIPAEDEADAVRIANDTIYGLNASVFTPDVDRARSVAGLLRSGTVGHNAFQTDFAMTFGGFKQSGIGREGLLEGLYPFLETKSVILDGRPAGY